MNHEIPADLRNGTLCQFGHPTRKHAYRLLAELWLPFSPAQIFPFFGDAANLETLTPPFLHFHVITPQPIAMQQGTTIDYRLKLHGIPVSWRSKISAWEPPLRFVDEQLRGPYRFWHHEHTFIEQAGGTLVRDEIAYGVPGGAIVQRLFVGPDLRKIFAYRQKMMRQIFQAGSTLAITTTTD